MVNGCDIKEKKLFINLKIHQITQLGHRAAVELLIKNGANLNAVSIQGQTPLYLAVGNGDLYNIQSLNFIVLLRKSLTKIVDQTFRKC